MSLLLFILSHENNSVSISLFTICKRNRIDGTMAEILPASSRRYDVTLLVCLFILSVRSSIVLFNPSGISGAAY
ncbi:hypothetical protein D3C85_1246910 [compost metagenome]